MPEVASLEPLTDAAIESQPSRAALDSVPTADTVSSPPPAQPPAEAANRPRRRLTAAVALVVVALLGGVAGSVATRQLENDAPASATPAAGAPAPSRQLVGESLDVAAVVSKAGPSVVSIQASFGGRGGSGAGTGFLLTAGGEILTNAHVVDGASSVHVVLAGEAQSREVDVVGFDDAADLALLRLPDADELPAAALGRSSDVAVGDDVVAIGNALALRGGPTVTRGIVSALDRTLETPGGAMTGLIQTDASISSGNSGGPLVNAAGQVVGINTAVAASRGGTAAENIGFAIAIDQAIPVVERLRGNTAAAATGLLGVRTADPDDGSRGAVVASVATDSPAARAGIQQGDLITSVDDRTVVGAAALAAAIRANQPGQTIELTLIRAGRTLTLRATLAASSPP